MVMPLMYPTCELLYQLSFLLFYFILYTKYF